MTTTTAVIENVGDKTFNRKDGSGQFKVYEVIAGGTTYRCDRPTAEEAWKWIGKLAELEVKSEKNGNYTNHYVNDVREPGSSSPNGENGQAPWEQAAGAAETASKTQNGSAEVDTQLSFHRQHAASWSLEVHKQFTPQFWADAFNLVQFLQTGRTPTVMSQAGVDYLANTFDATQVSTGSGDGTVTYTTTNQADTNTPLATDDIPF